MTNAIQTSPATTPMSSQEIRERFQVLRQQGLRTRDAAREMGISEGQAMCAHAVNLMTPQEEERSLYSVSVLDARWVELLQGLEGVGPVMALTRNESVVHEKTGVYRNLSANGPVGMALGPDIDLRLFLKQWHVGLHVVAHDPRLGPQHSLQFFDAHGQAIHKVHAKPNSDVLAMEALAQNHAGPEATPIFTPAPSAMTPITQEVSHVDIDALDKAWRGMADTHEFFDLIKRFNVSRINSLHLMQGRHTHRIPKNAVHALLQNAASIGLPIMVFAGNAGCLQIHTGAVYRIETMGPWLNVLDEGFNLHLRTDHIADAWLVRKPNADGGVTSIELFDATGEMICMFFGARKPGQAELPAWRELAQDLATLPNELPPVLSPAVGLSAKELA